MRERPRTCPSIRCSRLRHDALMSLRMPVIYPLPVSGSRGARRVTETIDHCGHAHADTARDPVCGMTVDPRRTAHTHAVAGRSYFFCSAGCRARFVADPAKYLDP